MSKNERDLSRYIDSLNAEKTPKEHGVNANSSEQEKLYEAVRLVRSLKEPDMPEEGFSKKLAKQATTIVRKKNTAKKPSKKWLINVAAVAVVLISVAIFNLISLFNDNNLVYAMEKAFNGVKAYHGILEVVQTNEDGQSTTQAKMEVWADKKGKYYIQGIEGAQEGIITVNNGKKKWQLRSGQKMIYTFPAFPDPYRFTFELGQEVKDAKNALKSEVLGEEIVSGRKTFILEVRPEGGVPYKLWIDKETELPIKKQSGIQNAIGYTAVYTMFELVDSIPAKHTAYGVPAGFKEIDTNPEQIVSNLSEARKIVGFTPKATESIPSAFTIENIAVETETKTVKLNYITKDNEKKVIILQSKADKKFKPAPTAVLGKVGSSTAEIQSPIQEALGILGGGGSYAGVTDISSIRWQQGGFEYAVVGNASIDVLTQFVEGLGLGEAQMPQKLAETEFQPKVNVPVDMEIEQNEQKSVDGGHSPWKLDPAFVAQVFVSLKMSPEGIQGEYPVEYKDMKVLENTGKDAIIEVEAKNVPVRKVYLKKLIRQDSTGIWTVVGYDPA